MHTVQAEHVAETGRQAREVALSRFEQRARSRYPPGAFDHEDGVLLPEVEAAIAESISKRDAEEKNTEELHFR